MITQIDLLILEFIQKLHFDALDKIMIFITHLGDGGAIWIVLGIVLLFWKKHRKTGICILVSLAVSALIFTLGMKNLIARERPFNNPLGLLNETMLLIPAPIDRYSFPSGHTLSSFAAAWCVFLRNRKVGAWCIVLAVLIAFSRLYLYVHYTTDIIFGAVFGILSAWAVNKIENKLSAYFGQRNRKK